MTATFAQETNSSACRDCWFVVFGGHEDVKSHYSKRFNDHKDAEQAFGRGLIVDDGGIRCLTLGIAIPNRFAAA